MSLSVTYTIISLFQIQVYALSVSEVLSITINALLYVSPCNIACQAKSEGLVRYPNSSSPNQGSVAVSAECVDNAHRISSSLTVMCNADGTWSGATPRCRCNSGYAPVNIGGEEICQADCPVNGSNTLPLPSPTYPPPPSSNSTPATPTTSATFCKYTQHFPCVPGFSFPTYRPQTKTFVWSLYRLEYNNIWIGHQS